VFESNQVCNGKCMETVYKDSTKNDASLVCRAKEVQLTDLKTTAKSCKKGEKIVIDVMGSISMTSARYDLGWYVAQDGGDALTGKCTINTLSNKSKYNVTDGKLSWLDDAVQPIDTCGDVFTTATALSTTPIHIKDTYLARGIEVPCQDVNNDGHLDISICFSWRDGVTDDKCDEFGPYPGSVSKCDCATWDFDTPVDEVIPGCL
jgi:hypothetical protein